MRALRFRFPRNLSIRVEPSASLHGGLQISQKGSLALTSHLEESIIQSIRMILSTIPGERVMRPDYGSRLHHIAFMPNDATTAGLAIQYVREAIGRWEPRIRIHHLDAGPAATQTECLLISLQYEILRDRLLREALITLQLQEGVMS